MSVHIVKCICLLLHFQVLSLMAMNISESVVHMYLNDSIWYKLSMAEL